MPMTRARRERADIVIGHRANGTPWRTIAAELGISDVQCRRDADALAKELRHEEDSPRHLEELIRSAETIKNQARREARQAEKPETRLKALDTALKADMRLARLRGVDAARKIQHSGSVGLPPVIESVSAGLAGLLGAEGVDESESGA